MTIAEASKILLRMKFRVGTDDLNTTIRICEENEAIGVVLKYCFDLASMCNENCPQIVRCKYCWKKGNSYLCRFDRDLEEHGSHRTEADDDWFCADGKRKESR